MANMCIVYIIMVIVQAMYVNTKMHWTIYILYFAE